VAWYATYNTAVLHFTFITKHRILEPLRSCVCPSSNSYTKWTIFRKRRTKYDIRLEFPIVIQHFSFTYIFIWVRKLDSNSLTKTKNWSGRNEVIETSGRLHPLWPQNKRLHTPRTTDYKHTRQGTWIQTELVSTLAKNATKPNPFEIVLLQTTRKENNWKTEETLERAVVTLETERIRGSNRWCLWWWWR